MNCLIAGSIINSYGHTFTSDETSFYLTFVDEINVQKDLIKKFLQEGKYDKAHDHLTRMAELYTDDLKDELAEKNKRISTEISATISSIGDQIKQQVDEKVVSTSLDDLDSILGESIDIRLEPEALDNSTVHALHFTALVNSLDINYKHSFVSNNALNNSEIENSEASSKSSQLEHKNNQSDVNHTEINGNNISDLVSYNTAKGLLTVIKDLYNTTVKQDINATKSTELDKIAISLDQVADVIDSKLSYKDLAIQIHGIIHPGIIEVYALDHLSINQPKTIISSGQGSHS
jgi:hypothetical protein